MNIPQTGLSKQEIFAALQAFKGRDMNWQAGKVFCYVYDPGEDPAEVTQEAYLAFLTENGLDPTVFPSLLKLETDVVRMIINLLRGDASAVGHLTSGGTESIMLAVKTARDKARVEQPHITQPEMVLPKTAHAAFHKAAHYLSVKPVVVDIDPATFKVRAEDMEKAVTENTILLVASAPNYSQGVIDPIAEIGAIAQKHNLLFHVDGCVGGIHLSFMRKLGYDIPDFDFTIAGVTSISADMHKYGYAAKGCSVIMYRSKEIRKYQIFACTDTTGYTLVNPTVLSSKSGGPFAGAWAILNFLGEEGYQRIVQTVQEATRKIIAGVNAIPELRVLGQPAMCMFSFASDVLNVYQLADEMGKRGWYIQGQFSTPLTPRNLHISVTYGSAPNADALLQDLRACVEILKAKEPIDSDSIKAMINMALQSPNPEAAFGQLAASAGLSGTELPTEMAFINEVMDALPDAVCNTFLINFFNDLYV
ncbi:MAG: aspartate aminotransferase family protein [Anaerolineaceae bacterium]|jgi:glutamate/tyrosine decarboxylase-like PLP-dependent enzyme|nr:aspartate aminotransferase family protein [Anaerolineaceae bacterium]OQY88934.1 MAG: aspartate aminotransferase family protein [Anaerolineae bacterium UTCFX1]